jgi:hypothetical protein
MRNEFFHVRHGLQPISPCDIQPPGRTVLRWPIPIRPRCFGQVRRTWMVVRFASISIEHARFPSMVVSWSKKTSHGLICLAHPSRRTVKRGDASYASISNYPGTPMGSGCPERMAAQMDYRRQQRACNANLFHRQIHSMPIFVYSC